ncbi:MAG: ankyrin repeat domain-containing protein, partial [Planctomycetota bacterium]
NGTALHVAAWFGRPDLVQTLLDDGRCGLETRDQTHNGTPLNWACHGATHCRPDDPVYVDVVKQLIAAGATVNVEPQDAGRPDVRAVLGTATEER